MTMLRILHILLMPTTRPRRLAAAIVTLATLATATSAAAQRTAADSVLALDSAWARAYATNDTALALRVMADDFFMTTSSGGVKDRAAELADIRATPGLRMDYFRTEQVRSRLYGSAAVVTGVAAWQFAMNERVNAIRRRYTAVYARGGPLGWRLVALHMGQAPAGS